MSMHQRFEIAEAPERQPYSDEAVLANYKMLEECILSDQVSDRELHDLTRSDPAFGLWLRQRVTLRRQERS